MTGATSVGFAGLGRMGGAMARNVLDAGFPLTVHNRTAARCEPLRSAGAAVAATPGEMAGASDVVVTMVADAEAARAVIDGPQGILSGARPGLVLVEMSTIGPEAARELAARAAADGVTMIDAPVSGSVSVAEAAQLTAMVGGEVEGFERARPVLEAMTKAQFHLGPSGAGAAMKLAVNVIIASTTHALSEALVLAETSGISRGDAYEVIANSAIASPFVAYKRAAFEDPDGTPPAFALDLMRKDLALALELGGRARIPLLAAGAACEAMTLAAGLRGGEEDLVGVADALRQLAANVATPEEASP
jgi:3-hydroxyisobutyrate dehydrogenase-like beta-hydroxyacid dehydrogenase